MNGISIALYEAFTPTAEHEAPADDSAANLALARRLVEGLAKVRRDAHDSHDLRLAESLTLHVIELLESSVRAGVLQ